MNNDFLKNKYEATGHYFIDFQDEVLHMDEHTHFMKVKCADVKLYHLFPEYTKNDVDIDDVVVYGSSVENTSYGNIKESIQKILEIQARQLGNVYMKSAFPVDENELTEIANDSFPSKTLVSVKGEIFFVGPSFISALAATVGLNGELLGTPSVERNNLIAYGLKRHENKLISLSYREMNGIKKLMDARSEKYERIPQKVILDIVQFISDEGMKNIQCNKWYLNHDYTRVRIQFPDIAPDFTQFNHGKDCTMIPGLEIMTSDVGQNSLMIHGVWTVNGAVSTHDSVIKRHYGESGEDTVPKIMEQVKRKIFAEFLQFPKKIIAMADIDITSSENSLALNERRLFNALKKASEACELKKVLGKKRERELINAMMETFDCGGLVTGYDIAIAFLEIPNKITIKNSESKVLDALAATVKNVVFADFSAINEYEENEQLTFDLL